MSARGVFVTGTDTGVGKTTISARLVSSLKANRIPVRYFKPVQTGLDSDTETVVRLAALERDELAEPAYWFPEPISPNRAAALHGREIEIDHVQGVFSKVMGAKGGFWVVEGAGGLLVPLNARQTIRDLALALELPLLIVASTRLGTINHTLLTVEAARAAGCRILGIFLNPLNGEDDPGLAELLAGLTGVPVWSEFGSEALERILS